MNKRLYIFGVGVIVLAGILFFVLKGGGTTGYAILDNFDGKVTFFKSGSCGCCSVYADYLKSKTELNVEFDNVADVSSIKTKYGIPGDLESCHTMLIGDYFVEGHVPLEAVNKLMTEKPDIAGIALAGMPSGAPGMLGGKEAPFIIYAVAKDGSYKEFMRI